jgi:nucleotide-binding universal stress UspA family protein
MYENVVVGINGLSGDRDAVALAKALSAANARLTLVNVRVMGAVPIDTAEAETVSAVAMSVGGGLHQVAKECGADLIVVGSPHRGAVGRMLAGDNARGALHHAPCAVAVAPGDYATGSAEIATIGVAYDQSEPSEVALAHAALLAACLGAKLHVREIVELHLYGATGWAPPAIDVEDPDVVSAAARERIGPIPGAEIEAVVGPALTELAALSDEVDVMVCGSRQQPAFKRLLMGSTSDYLARHCRCPLLVTPATDSLHVSAWREIRDAAAAV